MVAMRAVAVVVLFIEVKGIHIDAEGQGWAGPPGVERGDHAGETAFKRRQPAFRRALFAGALESLGQGILCLLYTSHKHRHEDRRQNRPDGRAAGDKHTQKSRQQRKACLLYTSRCV